MMKKLILTICFSILCGFVWAQAEHFTFKGLPIDGKEQDFIKRMESQGFTRVLYVDKAVLSGSFIGRDSYIMVYSTPNTQTVWKVMVLIEHTFNTWREIKSAFDQLVDLYTQKYDTPMFEVKRFENPWEDGDGHELQALKNGACIYGTGFLYAKDGERIGSVIIEMTKDCQIGIHYEDEKNFQLLEKECARDI